jgi:hypothetical protein
MHRSNPCRLACGICESGSTAAIRWSANKSSPAYIGIVSMTPEGKIKAKVKRALNSLSRCYSFMPVQMGMGAATLDYLCCINGHFVAIETKAPGKYLTPRQQLTSDTIKAAGGEVFVVYDNNSLEEMIYLIRLRCR